MMKRDIGSMRDVVVLMRKSETTALDADGYETFEDREVARLKASVRPKKMGGNVQFADQITTWDTFNVMVRYLDDIRTSDWFIQEYEVRGVSKKRRLEIKQIIDRDDRHRWLDILCVEKAEHQDGS